MKTNKAGKRQSSFQITVGDVCAKHVTTRVMNFLKTCAHHTQHALFHSHSITHLNTQPKLQLHNTRISSKGGGCVAQKML